MTWKGIVLAGGTGSRLFPVTTAVSKQLLPIYDKPMVFYPLSLLMLAGIRDVLLISTARDLGAYQELLGTGAGFGVRMSYAEQARPEGLAQAFLIGREFVGDASVCLVLGDNLLFGQGLTDKLRAACARTSGATVFAYEVKDADRFAVVDFDAQGRALSIEEKPAVPRSRFAVPGIYFYDNRVLDYARALTPSARGELEVTDLNRRYLADGELHVEILGRGYAWLDAGTHDSLIAASHFVQTVESRQRFKIACLEEIGYSRGWIDADALRAQAARFRGTEYAEHLLSLLSAERR